MFIWSVLVCYKFVSQSLNPALEYDPLELTTHGKFIKPVLSSWPTIVGEILMHVTNLAYNDATPCDGTHLAVVDVTIHLCVLVCAIAPLLFFHGVCCSTS